MNNLKYLEIFTVETEQKKTPSHSTQYNIPSHRKNGPQKYSPTMIKDLS